MAAAEQTMRAASLNPDDMPIANDIRRSGRPKKAPHKYDEEYIDPAEGPSQTKVTSRIDRPKRRAAEAALDRNEPEDVATLQEQIFARMDIDERQEYRGWVELESEPVSL